MVTSVYECNSSRHLNTLSHCFVNRASCCRVNATHQPTCGSSRLLQAWQLAEVSSHRSRQPSNLALAEFRDDRAAVIVFMSRLERWKPWGSFQNVRFLAVEYCAEARLVCPLWLSLSISWMRLRRLSELLSDTHEQREAALAEGFANENSYSSIFK